MISLLLSLAFSSAPAPGPDAASAIGPGRAIAKPAATIQTSEVRTRDGRLLRGRRDSMVGSFRASGYSVFEGAHCKPGRRSLHEHPDLDTLER